MQFTSITTPIISLLFALLLLLLPPASSKSPFYPGSNCLGGQCCHLETFRVLAEPPYGSIASSLTGLIDKINQTRIYTDNEEIACHMVIGHIQDVAAYICAILKSRVPMSGAQIRSWAHFIPDHGCRICGSVPVVSIEQGAVEVGEISYDCVSRMCDVDWHFDQPNGEAVTGKEVPWRYGLCKEGDGFMKPGEDDWNDPPKRRRGRSVGDEESMDE